MVDYLHSSIFPASSLSCVDVHGAVRLHPHALGAVRLRTRLKLHYFMRKTLTSILYPVSGV
eukprot:COSAG01_NODE_390_length_17672_cov_8.513287_13_plen_61_part_00